MARGDKLKEGTLWQRNAAAEIAGLQTDIFNGGTVPVALVGTSTTYAKVGGALFNTFADVGSVTTAETTLFTYTIPANAFATNGDKIEAEYAISLVNSTSTKQTKIKIAGSTIFDTGALTVSASGAILLRVTIIRDGSGSVRYAIAANTSGASTATYAAVGGIGITLTNTNVLSVTGTAAGVGVATNDLVGKLSRGLWFPAA